MVIHGTYVVHSVIRQRGSLICAVPLDNGHEDWLEFIPDPRSSDEGHRKGSTFSLEVNIRFTTDFTMTLVL
jgi:hypothetical protein